MNDLDELIAALRERGVSDSPAHTLMNDAADALEAATRVPVQGEPNDDRGSLITERTYGHGSITLTHYRSSGRIGVVQRGENSVMDVTDLLVFLQDSGLDEDFSRAAVPDAATEELDKVTLDRLQELAEERGYDKGFAAGWKSGGRTADLLAPKLRKAQAERDAALAVIERVRVVAFGHGKGAEDLPVDRDALKAALDGAPEPEEVEWEYGVRNRLTWKVGFPYSREGVADRIDDENRRVAGTYYVMRFEAVRRRKAGPWLPVEGESKP